MYKVFNWLFGWDYIGFDYGHSSEIRRLRRLPDGRYYVRVYGDIIVLPASRTVIPMTTGALRIVNEEGK